MEDLILSRMTISPLSLDVLYENRSFAILSRDLGEEKLGDEKGG
jgi:hypothetical protein